MLRSKMKTKLIATNKSSLRAEQMKMCAATANVIFRTIILILLAKHSAL